MVLPQGNRGSIGPPALSRRPDFHAMFSRRPKLGVFILEGCNSYAATCFFSYFYFFTRKQFGFSNKANLVVAALSGLIYVPSAFWAGRFAQRAGYYTALKVGFSVLVASLLAGRL